MTQNTEEELIILVSEENEQIGTMPKLAAHNAHTPLHRAFSCYIFNAQGEFLLTERALTKKVFPGIWTNSCCGHPGPGEEIEDAIARRLAYELGLVPDLIEIILPDFRYKTEMNGIVENEICPVFFATVSATPIPNPQEVESFQWIDWKLFKKEILKNPNKYSYWCREQMKLLSDNKAGKTFLKKI